MVVRNYIKTLQARRVDNRPDGSGERWQFTIVQDSRKQIIGYCVDHHHETKEEAEACYKGYLLDHCTSWNLTLDEWKPCAICGQETDQYVIVDMRRWMLCQRHHSRTDLSSLFTINDVS